QLHAEAFQGTDLLAIPDGPAVDTEHGGNARPVHVRVQDANGMAQAAQGERQVGADGALSNAAFATHHQDDVANRVEIDARRRSGRRGISHEVALGATSYPVNAGAHPEASPTRPGHPPLPSRRRAFWWAQEPPQPLATAKAGRLAKRARPRG